MDNDHAAKRRRPSPHSPNGNIVRKDDGNDGSFVLKSMATPVSPPRKRRREEADASRQELATATPANVESTPHSSCTSLPAPPSQPSLRSPFQLTAIHDLPASANVDAVTIRDVFGDPRVTECWEFNFLHDVDFLMSAFHEEARHRGLAVHIVHGFWKREDPRREHLEAAVRQYAGDNSKDGNKTTINLHTAFMPEPLGTHHTKMAVVFRNDETAQVIIHTANLIPHDWRNMTQAVWRNDPDRIGRQFKHDFLGYLRSYNQKRSVCKPLVDVLGRYDFSAVRETTTKQMASFGPLQPQQQKLPPRPQFRIMFPTADEIRRSLEGYDSGSSIHAKIKSPQQQKQLAYMRPMLCHWANDADDGAALPPIKSSCVGDAKRRRAAPHVKTYVRYSNSSDGCHVDWALMTSANLSKQAWGEARSAGGEMRIASYELGVLVWPELLTGNAETTMQPVFGRDDWGDSNAVASNMTVPLRIPYSLPVQGYGPGEIPWVATLPHSEPDWRGATAIV
ncbi:hypothetical protein SCUCBS95973_003677 [Sporothrix curviconia]|uniref:Tyrosyl-DNA phosphodiesterase n=1 Tax=Sporothrix curviconia TaxID=1260050 RepID=A0ABP0BIE1_9PEZI